ncbi:MAG: hypothetical protein HKN39_08045 [Flavobacteriales bacterium]|nr:hypothetical protein [Flavobacteriales bacterium]
MKKYLIGALLIASSLSTKAQENKLSSLYTNEQIKQLQNEQPQVLDYWMTYLEKGWVMDRIKEEQPLSNSISIHSEHLADLSSFNPLEYKVYPDEGTQYIDVNGSDLVLIVYPKSHIIYHYNKRRTK